MAVVNYRAVMSFIAIFLGLLAISGCATNPVSGKYDFVLMSEEQEIEMGMKHHSLIMEQYSEYDHPELQRYVENLGQKLAAASHRDNLEYHFTLLDSPEVNAFALPGGYIYITRGIMAYMNSEEDLAGVLGHEIGHVTARHGVRQHGTQAVVGLVGLIATIATDNQSAADAYSQIGDALVSGYGRNLELEADRLGAEYLARSNYDPARMLDVIGILKNQERFERQRAKEEGRPTRVYHGVFATHPRNDRRLQEVVHAAQKLKNDNPRETDPEDFLRLMDNVTFGDSEQQGIVRGNRLYHKDLDFTLAFPEGWRIDNQPAQLVAVRSDNEAIMVVGIDPLPEGESPAQYLQRRFTTLRKGEPLQDNRGYTGMVWGQTPFGYGPFRVIAVSHEGQVLRVKGFSKNRGVDQAFVDTAMSIRPLQPGEQQYAEARRIKLVRAESGDTFARLALQTDLGKYAVDQLRLLNDLYPDGEPAPGQLVKIIQ